MAWIQLCIVGRSLSPLPWKASALISCSQSGGDLYLEGGHMPPGLMAMPFIVRRGDHILFCLNVDPCYRGGEKWFMSMLFGDVLISPPHLSGHVPCSLF